MNKPPSPVRSAIANRLKLASLLLFCALASVALVSRLATADAGSAKPVPAQTASETTANHPPELAPVLLDRKSVV